MSRLALQIDCVILAAPNAGITGPLLEEKLLAARPVGLAVRVSRTLKELPQDSGTNAYLVATCELEEARFSVSDEVLSRLFLLGSTGPPRVLEHLEKFEMPGAVWAYEWFKLREFESHFRGFLRREVAAKMGLELLDGFESENYGWYGSGAGLAEFLAGYLEAFDQWRRDR